MIWGSRTFKQSLLQQIEQKKREDCATDFQRTSVIPSLETMMKTTAEVFDVKLAYLKNGKRGQENQPRIVAVYIMQQLGGYKQKEIMEKIRMSSTSAVGAAMKRCKQRLLHDKKLASIVNNLNKQLFYISGEK